MSRQRASGISAGTNSPRRGSSLSSSDSRPCSTARITATPVIDFEMLANRNKLSGCTEFLASTFAQPNPRAYSTRPPRPTANDAPGNLCFARKPDISSLSGVNRGSSMPVVGSEFLADSSAHIRTRQFSVPATARLLTKSRRESRCDMLLSLEDKKANGFRPDKTRRARPPRGASLRRSLGR